MKITLCGLGELWADYFNQLLPPGTASSEALRLEEIQPPGQAIVDYAFLAANRQALGALNPGAELYVLIHNEHSQAEMPEVLAQIKIPGASLLCLDGTKAPPCSLPVQSLSLGVELPATKPPPPNQPVVGLVGMDTATLSRLQSKVADTLRDRLIVLQDPENLSVAELRTELEQCSLVATGPATPHLVCWTALASGIPVAADISRLKHQQEHPEDSLMPVIHANADTLPEVLTSLTRDPRTLRDLSLRSVTYIRNSRRIERTRNQLARILTSR